MKKSITYILFLVVAVIFLFPLQFISASSASTMALTSPANEIFLQLYSSGSTLLQTTNLLFAPVQADDPRVIDGDKLVFGGEFNLKDGDILNGDLLVLGGIVHLEEGASINGDIAIIGGQFEINSYVLGDLFVMGGVGDVQAKATINGDVFTLGSQVNLDDAAVVNGEIHLGDIPDSGLVLPTIPSVPTMPKELPNLSKSLFSGFSIAHIITSAIVGFLWYILRSFLWAIVAILVVLFFPKPVDRVANAVVKQPFVDLAMGLLTAFVSLGLILLFIVTIIGIPISLLLIFVFSLCWAFGVISIGSEVGKRLSAAFNQHWASAVEAGVGVLLLTLVMNGIGKIIPCIGWLLPATVGVIGLGAVAMTKFGSTDYPASVSAEGGTALEGLSQINNSDMEPGKNSISQENANNSPEK